MFNSNKRKQHIKTLRYSPKCVDCLSPDVSITIYQLPPKHFSQTKLPADGAKILDVRSDELRSPYHCADFFSESYQTNFLYISHLISFCKGFPLTTCPMLHHYHHIGQILKNPPFRSHRSYIGSRQDQGGSAKSPKRICHCFPAPISCAWPPLQKWP